jgi:heptosyltransferase-3
LSKYYPTTGLWEREAVRLARCLSFLGDARLADRGSLFLDLTEEERAAADDHLRNWNGGESFICVSAGAKLRAKDWTIENWTAQLLAHYPDLGAAFLGAGSERQRAAALCSVCRGPKLNLCGKLTPRVSAGVIERAKLFLGHDNGPMHLAAAVHTPIVAIFSARARPGIWFPNQEKAEIFYRDVSCSNCNLKVCTIEKKKCLTSITPEQVTTACCRKLESHKLTIPAALIANISWRQ